MAELTPALEKLKEEGIGTAEMKDLVGQRAVSAFSILMEGTGTVNDLADALDNAGGSAQRMADIQLDSLDGKLTILNSAWEGFGIALFDYFEEPLKSATEAMTGWLGSMTKAMEITIADKTKKEKIEMNLLASALIRNLENEALRIEYREQLNAKYPELLSNLKDEELSIDTINEALAEQNKHFEARIKLAVQERAVQDAANEIADAFQNQVDAGLKLEEGLSNLSTLTGVSIDDSKSYAENVEIQTKAFSELDRKVTDYNTSQETLDELNERTGGSFRSWIDLNQVGVHAVNAVKWALDDFTESEEEVNKQTKRHTENLENLNKVLTDHGDILDDVGGKKPTDGGPLFPTPTGGDVEGPTDSIFDIFPPDSEEKFESIYAKQMEYAQSKIEWSKQNEEQYNNQAEQLAFELENRGKVSDLTMDQIEKLSELLEAGTSTAEALKEVFSYEEEEDVEPSFGGVKASEMEVLLQSFSDLEEEYGDTSLARQIALLDKRKDEMIAYYKAEQGASKANAKKIENIEKTTSKVKRQLALQSFSAGMGMMVANLEGAAEAGFVSQSVVKAASTVSTLVKTYESAQNAYNSMVGIPVVGPALAAVAAAAAVAAGMASLSQVKSVQPEKESAPAAAVESYIAAGKAAAKAQSGGLLGGKPHSQGGTMIEAERGEYIIKKDVVNRMGAGYFDMLNFGQYQEGGMVDIGDDIEGGFEDSPAQAVNITFSGNVLSREFVEGEVVEILQEYVRRGGRI